MEPNEKGPDDGYIGNKYGLFFLTPVGTSSGGLRMLIWGKARLT